MDEFVVSKLTHHGRIEHSEAIHSHCRHLARSPRPIDDDIVGELYAGCTVMLLERYVPSLPTLK